MIDAILPAGGRISGSFAEESGCGIKALIRLGGSTILERTIEALRGSGAVSRIVVIGPAELSGHPAVSCADAVLPEAESGPANIYRGLDWLSTRPSTIPYGPYGNHQLSTLILTTDLAFIAPESIRGFIRACPPDADLCLPVIRRESFEERFPGAESAFVRLRDGEWTMGCAFLVNPKAVVEHRIHIERIFNARKSQLAMACLLGPVFIARFLTRRLDIAHIEARCRQILGCSGAAISGCDPELAFDIDDPGDYRYALEHATERRNAA